MVIVPSIDVRGGVVVSRPTQSPEDVARALVKEGALELHLVDLDSAERGVPANGELLARIARGAGVPCRLAGGIDSVDQAHRAVHDGFAGVLFSSAIFGDDRLLGAVADLKDRAIVQIETQGGALAPRGGRPALAQAAAGRDTLEAARAAVSAGVSGLYVIDVGSDGRLSGPPLVLLESVRRGLGSQAASVAFHTGGGIRDVDDVRALARWGVTTAVIGRALADGALTLAAATAAGGQTN